LLVGDGGEKAFQFGGVGGIEAAFECFEALEKLGHCL
jgi:hypothetical protein